jgi:hypothetical protein
MQIKVNNIFNACTLNLVDSLEKLSGTGNYNTFRKILTYGIQFIKR